jgi:FO synthase
VVSVATWLKPVVMGIALPFGEVTYSPKVFIPLTMLCRDKCGYCTFAQPPARLERPTSRPTRCWPSPAAGADAGCHEALFTLGERPEERYPVAARVARPHGYASTVDYLAAMCRLVLDETGLLPHANAGALSPTSWPAAPVAPSRG